MADATDPGTREFLEAAVDRLRDEPAVRRVVLFGSHARGDPDEGSDVDLLVVLDSDSPALERWRRVRRLIAGERQRVPFDLIVFTPEELEDRLDIGDRFVEKVLEQGTVLHAA